MAELRQTNLKLYMLNLGKVRASTGALWHRARYDVTEQRVLKVACSLYSCRPAVVKTITPIVAEEKYKDYGDGSYRTLLEHHHIKSYLFCIDIAEKFSQIVKETGIMETAEQEQEFTAYYNTMRSEYAMENIVPTL